MMFGKSLRDAAQEWKRAQEHRDVARLVQRLEDLAEGAIDGGKMKLTYTEASAILAMLRDPKYFAEIEKIREALNM